MFPHIQRCSHAVLFYRDEATVRDNVAAYIAAALRLGQPALVIAKPALCQQLAIELHRQHVQGAPFGAGRGAFVTMDAESTLASFCRDGSPDPQLFHEVVGGALASLGAGDKHIAAYGEMVGLLCERGQYADAVRLEALWNDLLASSKASLYCGYAARLFDRPEARVFRDGIRAAHREVHEESAAVGGAPHRPPSAAFVDRQPR
jgi:hypothetical protein